jgi:hypothetical protein
MNIETWLQSVPSNRRTSNVCPYSVRWAPPYRFEPRAQVVLG